MPLVDHALVRFIDTVRDAHPDMLPLFMDGQCYNFFRVIREIRPQAEAWYSWCEGHVYVRVGRCFYDIRGAHVMVPRDMMKLDHRNGDAPHRWGRRDKRRLFDLGFVVPIQEKEEPCST